METPAPVSNNNLWDYDPDDHVCEACATYPDPEPPPARRPRQTFGQWLFGCLRDLVTTIIGLTLWGGFIFGVLFLAIIALDWMFPAPPRSPLPQCGADQHLEEIGFYDDSPDPTVRNRGPWTIYLCLPGPDPYG